MKLVERVLAAAAAQGAARDQHKHQGAEDQDCLADVDRGGGERRERSVASWSRAPLCSRNGGSSSETLAVACEAGVLARGELRRRRWLEREGMKRMEGVERARYEHCSCDKAADDDQRAEGCPGGAHRFK